MKKLPKEFKENWVAALRSGEYKQGIYMLHNDVNGTHCCLGVCEVVNNLDNAYDAVEKLTSEDTVVRLAEMNDEERKSFSEIAQYIEDNL